MLDAAMTTDDDVYWEQDTVKPASPKHKCQEAKEESLDNSISMVKTVMSAKKLQNQRSNPPHPKKRITKTTLLKRKLKQPDLQRMHKQWHHKSPPFHS